MMGDDGETENLLTAIFDRVGAVDGKLNLLVRAGAPGYIKEIRDAVRARPVYGQIYLLLDGKRTQKELIELLGESGVTTSRSAMSRDLESMNGYGMADVVRGGRYRRDPQTEKTLGLAKKVPKWLTEAGQVVPDVPGRRKKAA